MLSFVVYMIYIQKNSFKLVRFFTYLYIKRLYICVLIRKVMPIKKHSFVIFCLTNSTLKKLQHFDEDEEDEEDDDNDSQESESNEDDDEELEMNYDQDAEVN